MGSRGQHFLSRGVLVASVMLGGASSAASPSDPSHGRFDGDLAIAGALGPTMSPRGLRVTADLRLRYLSTAGVFGTYEDGASFDTSAEPRRALAFGIELRPLFLGRWATDRELGRPRLDMFIDSLGLELGAVFQEPKGARFGAKPGLQMGLGVELPFFTRPSGPFLSLHGGVRLSDVALSGGPLEGPSDRSLYLLIAIGWQQLFGGHVVDLGDRSRE